MSEKTKKLSISFDGFGGIDHNVLHDPKNVADDIVNFRITKDGSLKKRPGYRLLADLGSDIRAISPLYVRNKQQLLVLCGHRVFCIDPDTGSREMLGYTNSYVGHAAFFCYNGMILLIDGCEVFKYVDGQFSNAMGYIPLVGENWSTDVPGEVLEPRNIINNYARLTYIVPPASTVFFHTKYPVKSVKRVFLNGTLLPSTAYEINRRFTTVDLLESIYEGDVIEIHLEYEPELAELKNHLLNSCSSALFGSTGYTGIFLCGGNGSNSVFRSQNVGPEGEKGAFSFSESSDVIYFPEHSHFEVGDGIHEIKSVVRHRDKILIFTGSDVWMTSPDIINEGNIPAVSINSNIGCVTNNGAIPVKNETVSIGRNSIWRWSGDADDSSSYSATNISSEINDELCLHGTENCGIFFDPLKDEIWVYSKISDVAWIFNGENNCWYKYKGIHAKDMAFVGRHVVFTNGGRIFIIDDDLSADYPSEEVVTPIDAYYYSAVKDFGSSRLKNLAALSLRADTGGEPVSIEFDCDNNETYRFSLYDPKARGHSVINKRLFSGRFCCTGIRISSSSLASQVIHGLTVKTR